MDYFLLFGIIGFSCLILGFIGYSTTTNKIIRDQEREIASLTTENKRLKRYIDCLNHAARAGHNISSDPASVTFRVINPEGNKVLEDLFKIW